MTLSNNRSFNYRYDSKLGYTAVNKMEVPILGVYSPVKELKKNY